MSVPHILVVSLLIVLGAAEGKQVPRREFAKWRALRGFGRNSVQNAPPGMCVKAVDIGIVMDRRLRTGPGTDLADIKNFVNNITHQQFEISHDMAHIGAISYDETSAEILFDFRQGNSLDAVDQQMKELSPGSEAKDGPVAIDKALQLSLRLFTDQEHGSRGYDEVLVLLTDGRYDSRSPSKLVGDLVNKDVNVIVVGIGIPDPVELFLISNKQNTVLNMMNSKMVDSAAENVKKLACSTAVPKP